MQFREDIIDLAMTTALGIPLKVGIAQEAVDVEDMSPGESVRFDQVAATPRLGGYIADTPKIRNGGMTP